MVPGLAGMECNQSLVVCLAMAFMPDTKYTDKHFLLFHHHQPSSLLPPPFLTAASCPDHPPWTKQHVGAPVDCHIMCCRLSSLALPHTDILDITEILLR